MKTNSKSSLAKGGGFLLLLLAIATAIPAQAQYAGRQGRTDELAEYARHKKKKVTMARTYLFSADSSGSIATADRQLIQVRHFDAQGRVQTDTIFHYEDGLPFLARSLQYRDGRQVSATERRLDPDAPMTSTHTYHFNAEGWLYLAVVEGGNGRSDTTKYHLDADGNVVSYIRLDGNTADTTLCELNPEGRTQRAATLGKPSMITEYAYNTKGQPTRMTETMDYGLLGQSNMTTREFEYGKHSLLRAIRDYDPQGVLLSEFQVVYWNKKGRRRF